MYITDVVPLTKIPQPLPQILSYFTSQKLEKGSLVLIPLQKKNTEAIVFSQKEAKDLKQEIKKADFAFRPILEVIEKDPLLDERQLNLAKWISDYYFASFGKVLKLFLTANKKSQSQLKKPIQSSTKSKLNKSIKPILYFSPPDFLPENEIKETFFEKKEILLLVPEKNKIDFFRKKIAKIQNQNNKNLQITIAARSGLFFPFQKLGLVIVSDVDNESYKEQREPRLFAPDVAQKLAEIWGAKLIFLSVLPGADYYFKAKTGKILWKKIENKKEIQKVEININSLKNSGDKNDSLTSLKDYNSLSAKRSYFLKNSNKSKNDQKNWSPFSPVVLKEIEKYLESKKKILLFINRKGTATNLLCQDCGWQKFCKNCGVPLTYHINHPPFTINHPMMVCHYCGFKNNVPEYCENCKSWRLTTLGIGAEEVEKEIKNKFPQAKIFRLDREISPKIKDQKKTLQEFFEKGDILVSTSLIFSYIFARYVDKSLRAEKELKFALTVFVSFGAQLSLPDFRFEEKLRRQIEKLCFLTSEKFLLQNRSKREILGKSLKEFYNKELEERKKYFYPPFSQLIKLTFKHKNLEITKKEAYVLKEKLEKQLNNFLTNNSQSTVRVLGPVPAFISKIKGRYRWNILIKIKRPETRIQNKLLQVVPPEWEVDIDPINFF